MEVVVSLGDIVRTTESDFTDECGVWELDTNIGSLKTWKRVEYAMDRVDELVLVESGAAVDPCRSR